MNKNCMSWDEKRYIGSQWIKGKTTENGSELLWGFPSWDSVHSHRVINLEGSFVYNRVISGIELIM